MLAKTVEEAVAVPAASVLTAPDGTTNVMVIGPDNRAHQTPVKTGIRDGDKIQIVEGIAPGARVILAGAYGLPDKTKVTVEASAEPEGGKPAAGSEDKDKKDDKKD
jgi:multidrug efflux pump subunit AcrA (membrane-fusion protein)